jgi:hypothetical protein
LLCDGCGVARACCGAELGRRLLGFYREEASMYELPSSHACNLANPRDKSLNLNVAYCSCRRQKAWSHWRIGLFQITDSSSCLCSQRTCPNLQILRFCMVEMKVHGIW